MDETILDIMAYSQQNIIFLLEENESYKLEVIKDLLHNNSDLWYIHETHIKCPYVISLERKRSSHWTLIIFSNKSYMNLMTLVLGMNAQIPVDEIDEDVMCETFAVN